ncbi:MAG: hypothetical protein SOR58_04200 [Megasphaera massiliensis]|jgi:hypothetical protein|uniref:hypothetical protein n=1 Tax=Megasphaera massiliensis TaxID=1232428 RepID=UPI002A74B1FA|nr:hypothetical protein [Megasphaera massiliensis]MDY2965386.1 hypothetical protein [Megasphaera massiliensis]
MKKKVLLIVAALSVMAGFSAFAANSYSDQYDSSYYNNGYYCHGNGYYSDNGDGYNDGYCHGPYMGHHGYQR